MKKYLIIAFVLFSTFFVLVSIKSYTAQYNKDNISNFLCVSIDSSKGLEYIGKYNDYKVYTYNLKEAYFVDVNANNIQLSEGLSSGHITIEDMKKHLKLVESRDTKVYESENYKLIIKQDICVISPLDTDNSIIDMIK